LSASEGSLRHGNEILCRATQKFALLAFSTGDQSPVYKTALAEAS